MWPLWYQEDPKVNKNRGGDLEPMIILKLPGSASCNRLCVHGKYRLTSMHNSMFKPTVEYSDVIQEGNILPGNCVNTNQYECRLKGWLPNKRGKEGPYNMYCGGTLFLDHATNKIKFDHQVSLGASDTVRSKELYEINSLESGVTVKSYIGDNGVFKTVQFKEDVDESHHMMSLLGVVSHD